MGTRLSLILLCALLMPAAGFAAVVTFEVNISEDEEPADYEPADGYLQYRCGDEEDSFEVKDGKVTNTPFLTGSCDFRVVTDLNNDLFSTVASFFFEGEPGKKLTLHLFIEKRGEEDRFLWGFISD